LIVGVLSGALACVAHYLRQQWGSDPLFWSLLPIMAGMLVGLLAFSYLSPLERAMIDRRVLERRVRMRAEAAFLEEEVFHTRDRTGILLFLAMFERRAVVLGDEGINRKVEFEDWEAIVETLTAGLRGPNPTAAVAEAVERCGRLLEEKKVELRADDVDELADAPRTRAT
jgi:putative membrane protein